MTTQTTIRSPVRFSHRGLLTGRPASIRLRPGPPDSGIVFNDSLPALLRHAFVENHFVNLGNGRDIVMAVEHLLAACYGLGIDNLRVDVTGGEVPFGDGSALPFVRILQAAGLRRQTPAARIQTVRQPIIVHQDDAFICALPVEPGSTGLALSYFIRFPELEPHEQFFQGMVTPAAFPEDLGAARTFGYRQEGWRLPSWLDRACHIKGNLILPARLRCADEPVRHKALDLLGDLCLLGRRLSALIIAHKAGHRLHHELVSELEDQWT
jgi:UDP-3-O-acyl-N-acetylglucosamine deacetylase